MSDGTPATIGTTLDDDALITKPRNAPFTALMNFDAGETVGVQIVRFPTVITARTTDVDEIAPGTYQAELTAPSVAGEYAILWDDGTNWKWSWLKVTNSLYFAAEEDATPTYLTEEEAAGKIQRMTDAATDPALDSDDIADLIQVACRPDADGLTRADAAWVPTWDLNAAAAEGWMRKASKAAARFNFAEDGQRFDRAQIYAHCSAQAKRYADKAMGSLPHTT